MPGMTPSGGAGDRRGRPGAGPAYRYQSDQDSLLLPFYRRHVWDPLLPFIPRSVSPNTLTVLGTSCAAAACALALTATEGRSWPLAASAVLVLLYITLDNLDGLHARRTGQSSRLGEFLDHWLDTLNSSFLAVAVCRSVLMPDWLTMAMIACANLSFFAVHWAHRRSGIMRLGKIADIEGGTLVALILLAMAVAGTRMWSWLTFVLAAGMAGQSFWTVISSFVQVRVARRDWIPLCAGTAGAAAWFASGASPFWAAAIMMAALNPLSTGRAIAGRVGAAGRIRLDVAAAILVTAGAAVAFARPGAAMAGPAIAWAAAGVVAACAAVELVHGLRCLSQPET